VENIAVTPEDIGKLFEKNPQAALQAQNIALLRTLGERQALIERLQENIINLEKGTAVSSTDGRAEMVGATSAKT
jgi:hypothetical protein